MDLPLAFILLPLDSATALYFALFAVMILSGVGLPVPEEITLLFGGYLVYLEFISFWPAFYVLTAGIIAADIAGYILGRLVGGRVTAKISHMKYAARFLERGRHYFERHGEKVVIFSRPLLGVRVAVPVLAGHFRMKFLKFFVYDVMAAVPWTFFLVSLSYYFGSGLELITEVKEIKYAFLILALSAFLTYAAIFMKKMRD